MVSNLFIINVLFGDNVLSLPFRKDRERMVGFWEARKRGEQIGIKRCLHETTWKVRKEAGK